MNTGVVIVNYNTPDLLRQCISSFREYHMTAIPIHIVDNSDVKQCQTEVKAIADTFNCIVHSMSSNLNHGPALAWAIKNIQHEYLLFLDSDIITLRPFLHLMEKIVYPEMYGAGCVMFIDKAGVPIGGSRGAERRLEVHNGVSGLPYIHPAFMLLNVEVAKRYTLPVHHGAPMIAPMQELPHLVHLWWAHDDLVLHHKKHFHHIGKGTRTAIMNHEQDWERMRILEHADDLNYIT